MARKKVTHEPQQPNQENPQEQKQTLSREASMEDPNKKLQSLKSLNSLLLKEAFERRQQVQSLVQAKEALETELTQSSVERTELESELTRAGEETVSLEMEKGVFFVFIETQMGEMGVGFDGLVREKIKKDNEIGYLKSEVNGLMVDLEFEREKLNRVCQERDLLRSDVDSWIKEANGLRERVIEMEKKERNAEEEIGKLKMEYDILIKQEKERENKIDELKRFKHSAERSLMDRVKEIEDLKREIEEVVREKNEIGTESSILKVKISGLEKQVWDLNEVVMSLQKEEGVLRNKVLELEKSYGEALEKERAMAMENNALIKENKEMEKIIKRLMEEKDSSERYIKTVEIEMKDKNELIEKLLRKKKELEEAKALKESEIVELHKEVDGLKYVASAMQDTIKDHKDKSKQLASEVCHYRDAFERVSLEKGNIQKGLDEEKKNGMDLKSDILKLEKRIEETVEESAKMKNECAHLIEEKKEMESLLGLLENEKDSVQKNLSESQREIHDFKTKLESAGINSERTLAMLKNTAAFVCQSNDEKEQGVNEKKLDGEIAPYGTVLEVIKNAFRNKETVVEETKLRVEFLQNSLAEAEKKKSFWAKVSSVMTVFAAISLAYVARIR